MNHRFLAVSAAVLLVAAGTAAAHSPMHMSMDSEPALGATAAFAPDGRLWVVSAHDGHVWLRHSDDFGSQLSTPVAINEKAEPVSAEGENRPKIALGPKGEIYISWTQPLPRPYTGKIRFARSLDNGKRFDTPITVHHDKAEITHRFDALAVDGTGHVLVAWIDKRDVQAAEAQGRPYLGAAVYYAWSNDRGASFAREHKLADNSCECCRIELARTPDGTVAAFWRAVYGDSIRDHAYAVLRDGGARPEPARATFADWHIEGCPHHGPGLAIAADGSAHGVWFSAKDDVPTIWYGILDPGQSPQQLRKIAGAGAAHADISVEGKTVWITWNQFATEGTKLMLLVSHDGGATFASPEAIATSKGATGSPQLLRWRERTFVAWNTADGFRLIAVEATP